MYALVFGLLFAILGLNNHAMVTGGGPITHHLPAVDRPFVTGGGPITKK